MSCVSSLIVGTKSHYQTVNVHTLAWHGLVEELQQTLKHCPNRVNEKASDKARPLHKACFRAQIASAKILIEHGASIEATTKTGSVRFMYYKNPY